LVTVGNIVRPLWRMFVGRPLWRAFPLAAHEVEIADQLEEPLPGRRPLGAECEWVLYAVQLHLLEDGAHQP
jgi:hypothetical protein